MQVRVHPCWSVLVRLYTVFVRAGTVSVRVGPCWSVLVRVCTVLVRVATVLGPCWHRVGTGVIRDTPGSKTLSRTATVQHGPSRTSTAPLRMTTDPTRRLHGSPRTRRSARTSTDQHGSFWPPKTSGVDSRTSTDQHGPSRTIKDHPGSPRTQHGTNTDQTPDHTGWGPGWSLMVRDPNGTGT